MPHDDHRTDDPDFDVWPYRKDFLLATGPLDEIITGELGELFEITGRAELGERVDSEFTEEHFNALTGREAPARTRWLYDTSNIPDELFKDPLKVARVVRDAQVVDQNNVPIMASPISAITWSGHVTFMPATNPKHAQELDAMPPSNTANPSHIAVVDTGYNETDEPGWLKDRVRALDSVLDADVWDTNSKWRGHGKFVASIIVQQNPDAFVWVAALKPILPELFFEWFRLPPGFPKDDGYPHWFEVKNDGSDLYQLVDEFALWSAVVRLLENRPNLGGDDYKALNLSLGAWVNQSDVFAGLGIQAALDLWREETDAPIVAAAGNHNHPVAAHPHHLTEPVDLFIPGQWRQDRLYGVASEKRNGQQSVFSNDAPIDPHGRRVVGEALLGVLDDGAPGQWSGTSFATAVVSAHVASTNPPQKSVALSSFIDAGVAEEPIFPPGDG